MLQRNTSINDMKKTLSVNIHKTLHNWIQSIWHGAQRAILRRRPSRCPPDFLCCGKRAKDRVIEPRSFLQIDGGATHYVNICLRPLVFLIEDKEKKEAHAASHPTISLVNTSRNKIRFYLKSPEYITKETE